MGIFEDKYFAKKLRRHRSNKEVIDKYGNASLEPARSANPEELGGCKRGRLRYAYAYRTTMSCRLPYRVDRNEGSIVMVDLDDHKNVHGRD